MDHDAAANQARQTEYVAFSKVLRTSVLTSRWYQQNWNEFWDAT